MNYFIKKSINIITSNIAKQDKIFIPCSRNPCYCNIVVNYPKYTKITSELIENANKCKDEYYIIQKYVDSENPR